MLLTPLSPRLCLARWLSCLLLLPGGPCPLPGSGCLQGVRRGPHNTGHRVAIVVHIAKLWDGAGYAMSGWDEYKFLFSTKG